MTKKLTIEIYDTVTDTVAAIQEDGADRVVYIIDTENDLAVARSVGCAVRDYLRGYSGMKERE